MLCGVRKSFPEREGLLQQKVLGVLEAVEVVAGCHAFLAGRLQLYDFEPLVGGGNEEATVFDFECSDFYTGWLVVGVCCFIVWCT